MKTLQLWRHAAAVSLLALTCTAAVGSRPVHDKGPTGQETSAHAAVHTAALTPATLDHLSVLWTQRPDDAFAGLSAIVREYERNPMSQDEASVSRMYWLMTRATMLRTPNACATAYLSLTKALEHGLLERWPGKYARQVADARADLEGCVPLQARQELALEALQQVKQSLTTASEVRAQQVEREMVGQLSPPAASELSAAEKSIPLATQIGAWLDKMAFVHAVSVQLFGSNVQTVLGSSPAFVLAALLAVCVMLMTFCINLLGLAIRLPLAILDSVQRHPTASSAKTGFTRAQSRERTRRQSKVERPARKTLERLDPWG